MAPAPAVIYTLSLHDALPIFDHLVFEVRARVEEHEQVVAVLRRDLGGRTRRQLGVVDVVDLDLAVVLVLRSEEHTSELQSLTNLVCRLLLEKKKTQIITYHHP